jgi:hypothetical protein
MAGKYVGERDFGRLRFCAIGALATMAQLADGCSSVS